MISESIIELGTKKPLVGLDGKDLDDTPEMIKLTDEISKLSSITNRQEANWNLVEQCSRIILRDYVKHFQVACYYGESLIKLGQGVMGLCSAASVFNGICQNFWQEALPPIKRKKGRFNSINYWLEKVTDYLENYNGDEIEPDLMNEAKDVFRSLDNTLAEIDEDNAPNLRPIINLIDKLPIKTVDEPISEVTDKPDKSKEAESSWTIIKKEEKTETPTPKPIAKPISEPISVDVPVDANVEQKIKIATNLLGSIADDLFAQDLYNPLSYRYRRASAWLNLKAIPYNENNVTRIVAPNDEIKNSIEKLFLSNQFEAVIKMTEPRITQYLYWLDLSFYSWKSLMELKQEDAAREIAFSITTLIKRIKGIENLCFDDGSTMSNSETKTWLVGLLEAKDQSSNVGSDVVKTNINDVLNLSISNINESLLIIENYIKVSQGIDILRYKVVLALVFARNKRFELAVGILDEVLSIVEDHQIADWNTSIGIEIYSFAFDVLKLSEKLEEAQRVLVKLAQLSPTVAMSKSFTDE